MANITLFAQAIGRLPKECIRKIIREEKTDKHSKGYDTWSQFISMMFCQFSGCDSVRDISNGLNSANGNLNHLGICRAPSKSTVAYQNAKRDSGVFRRIFYALLAHFGQQTVWQRTRFRFKMPIKLLNSSNSANGNLNHLGICRAPSKSTVAYQNAKRDSGVFRRIFYALLAHFGQQTVWQRTRFRFKMPIKLLNSSTITLTMSLYEWAHYTTRKGAVKMHTLLDYDSLLTEFVNITDGKCGDNRGALNIPVPPHSVVVADRGYCDVGRHRRLADPSRPWAKTCHGLYGRGSCSQGHRTGQAERQQSSGSLAEGHWCFGYSRFTSFCSRCRSWLLRFLPS